MGLVKNHRIVLRKDFPCGALAQREVSKEEMMVYDHQIGDRCFCADTIEKTAGMLGALLSETLVGAGAYFIPGVKLIGEPFNLSSIPCLRPCSPTLETSHESCFRLAVEIRLITEIMEAATAKVISPPFQANRMKSGKERPFQKGNIMVENLVLKCLGAGGNDDTLSTQDGWYEICPRLSRTCSSLYQQGDFTHEAAGNSLCHFQL
jgi:hypothetical protein